MPTQHREESKQDITQFQDVLNVRQHQNSAKASITIKAVMPIRRGKSGLLAAGGEDGNGVEEMLVVGTGAGVGSWILLHTGCVPLANGVLLCPLLFV